MVQVLDNLIGNAIRYTPEEGTVLVSTGTEEAEDRTWATVSDTGIGIPEKELPHIFDRFFRSVEPRSMQISGTGLGLAIVKEIVELHGGWVTVESPSTGSGQAPSTLRLRSGQAGSPRLRFPRLRSGQAGQAGQAPSTALKAGEEGVGSTFTVWLPLAD